MRQDRGAKSAPSCRKLSYPIVTARSLAALTEQREVTAANSIEHGSFASSARGSVEPIKSRIPVGLQDTLEVLMAARIFAAATNA